MKTKIFLLGAASLLLASCSSELDVSLNEALGSGKTNLSINVVTENIESKGLVTGSYLAERAEIGVTVLNTSGGYYDGTEYNNISLVNCLSFILELMYFKSFRRIIKYVEGKA